MSWNSTSDKCKECSLEEIEQRAHAEQSQDFETYQKLERDTCMQIRRRQLGGEPPVHNRSMVKISYNIKMTT